MKKTLLGLAILAVVCLSFLAGLIVAKNEMPVNGASVASNTNLQIGIVNVNQIFNDSTFVKKANQQLRADVQNWQSQVNKEQQKLKNMLAAYQAKKNTLSSADQKAAEQQITAEQNKLIKLIQTAQQSIKAEQVAGMQKFTSMVRDASQSVANSQHLNLVLTSNIAVYANQDLDVTKAVESQMPNS